MRYLGSFPQKLCQSDNVGFKLSLVSPLTSHLQPWIIRSFWDEGPAVPVIRCDRLDFSNNADQFCHLKHSRREKNKTPIILKSSWGNWLLIRPLSASILTFGTEAGLQEAGPGPGPGACRQTGRGWAIADCCRRWRSRFHQNRWSLTQPQKVQKSFRHKSKRRILNFNYAVGLL